MLVTHISYRPNRVAFLCSFYNACVFQAMVLNEKSQCLILIDVIPRSLGYLPGSIHRERYLSGVYTYQDMPKIRFFAIAGRLVAWSTRSLSPESANVWLNHTPSNVTQYLTDTLGSTKS